MGRQRIWSRKHFLFYIAGFVSLVVAMQGGCTHFADDRFVEEPLSKANHHIAIGDFPAALAENDKALQNYLPKTGAEVFFQRGLILSHPLNPKPDYAKAIEYFQEILREFPNSPNAVEAERMIFSLHNMMIMESEIVSLNGKIGLAEITIKQQKETINLLRKKSKRQQSLIKKLKRKINELTDLETELITQITELHAQETALTFQITELNAQVAELAAQVTELNTQIEKMKSIDIQIEKEKRKNNP